MQFVDNFTGKGDAPKPMTKDKMCYQGRQGVKPTTTASLAFRNSAEGDAWKLQPSTDVMAYSDIDGRSPSGVERGTEPPAGQSRKGA